MSSLKSKNGLFLGFLRDEEGLTVVEYVVGAAALVAALTGVFVAFGSGLQESMSGTMIKLPNVKG